MKETEKSPKPSQKRKQPPRDKVSLGSNEDFLFT